MVAQAAATRAGAGGDVVEKMLDAVYRLGLHRDAVGLRAAQGLRELSAVPPGRRGPGWWESCEQWATWLATRLGPATATVAIAARLAELADAEEGGR